MYRDLNDFVAALEKERELARIGERVSPDLEISAVADRVSKSPGGGPGLLFEQPDGFDIPVAVNLFGSMKRMCMALGVATLDDLAREIEALTTPKIPGRTKTFFTSASPPTVRARRRICADIGTL